MIHFITPLYRYNNIKIIYWSIINLTDKFIWHLIEGSNKIGEESLDFLKDDERVKFYKIDTNFEWGHEQRNYFKSNIGGDDEDWCYFLDDDTVVTQDLIEEITNEENKEYGLILFSQKCGLTEKIRLYGMSDRLRLGSCDIGSFLIKYKFLKRLSPLRVDLRNSDGHMADECNRYINEYKFKFISDKFVRYNALSQIIF